MTTTEQEILVNENGTEFEVLLTEPIEGMEVFSPLTNKKVMDVSFDGVTVSMVLAEGFGFTENGDVISA